MPDATGELAAEHVPRILGAFGLGETGRLSDGPVARGRLGAIWRLDTTSGAWAVKQLPAEEDERREILDGAAFQEAAGAAGVPVPAVRRTRDGALVADVGGPVVRVLAWVDLEPADPGLDPAAVGRLVAALHRVPFAGATGAHPWYSVPPSERTWRALASSLRAARAPFADELDALRPELAALAGLLAPPRALRTCHRDLWADNVRRTADGGLCVFDFDNAGLADPSQELAAVLVEYADRDAARARALVGAYEAAGGPGRLEGLGDFTMAIAQLSNILATGCRRWLAATTDADRAENESWVRESLDRPLTRELIEGLLAA